MNSFPKLFIAALVLLLTLTGCSRDEPATRHFTIGIINPAKGHEKVVEGFKDGLAERGYREGENITYIDKGVLNRMEKVDAALAEILAADVDLIYSMTTPGTRKAQIATAGKGIPVVFGPVFSPVSSRIVQSMTKPEGNTTGIKIRGSSAKALEWLLAVVPTVKRIYIPFHYTDKAACQTVEDLQKAAGKLGIELVPSQLDSQAELERTIAAIPNDVDAVWLTCSHLLFGNIQAIVAAATGKNLPVASSTSQQEDGILVSYGEDNYQLGRQASRLADKILQGVSPADLPVENAQYYLNINLKTAEALGIIVPEHILRQADFIVR